MSSRIPKSTLPYMRLPANVWVMNISIGSIYLVSHLMFPSLLVSHRFLSAQTQCR